MYPSIQLYPHWFHLHIQATVFLFDRTVYIVGVDFHHVAISFPPESQNHVHSRVIAFEESNQELTNSRTMAITVGVLALQGAFFEHIQLLKKAAEQAPPSEWQFIEVRTPQELSTCDGLVLPGGESTTMSLVAARSNLLEPLREFVK
jgi:hypothetical protein